LVQNFYVLCGYEFNVKQQLRMLLSRKKTKFTLQFTSEDVEEPL